jgi:hypothetical protein
MPSVHVALELSCAVTPACDTTDEQRHPAPQSLAWRSERACEPGAADGNGLAGAVAKRGSRAASLPFIAVAGFVFGADLLHAGRPKPTDMR